MTSSSPYGTEVFLTQEEAQELVQEYSVAKDSDRDFYHNYMTLRFGDGVVNSRHWLSHREALQVLVIPIPVSTTDISRLKAANIPLSELANISAELSLHVGDGQQRSLLADYVTDRCSRNMSHDEAIEEMTY